MSPAEKAVLRDCFAVRRGEAKKRLDVNYNVLTDVVEGRLAHSRYPLKKIGEIEKRLQYGCSKRAIIEPVGVRILRMNNLQAHGWDLNDIKYVELTDKALASWRLRPGDIVFNRTNSKELVGKCEVFREAGIWVFASYLMRLEVDESQAIPEFVAAFLNGPVGRVQIDRESRQIIGMSNINAEEIRSLRISLPPPAKQVQMLAALDVARVAWQKKLTEADDLLASLNEFVLDALGLTISSADDNQTIYAVRARDVQIVDKLDPDYFHPERIRTIRAVESRYTGDRAMTLSGIADFVREQRIIEPDDDYLGLANVQPNTGERIESNDVQSKGNCFVYGESDVLFARLRPYLNKVHRAESDGVCSTEFHVIRVRKDDRGRPYVIPDYLAAVLRSSLVLFQTRHMMTGNTHPRIANQDVVNLVIPIPEPQVQVRIADEVAHRGNEARQLRDDARSGWDDAKCRFEEELLEPSPTNGKGGHN